MIAHEHDNERWTPEQLHEHILGMHEGVSATGDDISLIEAAHREDHLKAMREVLAMAGLSTKGLVVEGMPTIFEAYTPTMPGAGLTDTGVPIREFVEQAVARLNQDPEPPTPEAPPALAIRTLTDEQYGKLLAARNLIGEALGL